MNHGLGARIHRGHDITSVDHHSPGADPETLSILDDEANEVTHTFPFILPDKRGVLFTVSKETYRNTQIEALEFNHDKNQRHLVLENAYFVEYAPSGHLLFGREGTIFAVPFDLETLTVTGSDGSQLAVTLDHGGLGSPFLIDIASKIAAKKVISSNYSCSVNSWSRDGRHLICTERMPYDKTRIIGISMDDSERKAVLLTYDDINERMGNLSPDGQWMAYVSDQEGLPEVYIRSMDGNVREKVSLTGGAEPAWSSEGRELFYMNKDGTALLSIDVKTGEGLELGRETVVFKEPDGFEFLKHNPSYMNRVSYDINPDGQRFLFVVKK
ncbi:MAG: hypothetical protein WBE11_17060 [Candidatus Aminicenantaceae bacterium]